MPMLKHGKGDMGILDSFKYQSILDTSHSGFTKAAEISSSSMITTKSINLSQQSSSFKRIKIYELLTWKESVC